MSIILGSIEGCARGKLPTLNIYMQTKKKKELKTSDSRFHYKRIEEQENKPKVNRGKELVNMKSKSMK